MRLTAPSALAIVLTSAALASCGTTVPLTSQAAAGSADASAANGTLGGFGIPSTPSQQLGGTPQGAGPGSFPLSTTPPGSTSGNRPGTTPSGPTVPEAKGPTGGEIRVGIPYIDQGQSSSFTANFSNGLATGDDKANYTAIINDLNAKGGILGRKVVPFFHAVDITEPASRYQQEICTDFTQDHKVSFVLSGNDPVVSRCVIRKGLGVIGDGSQINSKDYDSMPYYVQPGSIALDRLAALQAREFTAMGLFTGAVPAKVGVLFYETAAYQAAEKVLVAGLRQRGINVVEEEAFSYAASTQDLGAQQSQVQSAVLKFRSSGVTHVVGVELNAFLQGFFALYADQQHYYPRYGWTSDQVPINVAAVAPHRALQNSLVIGFYPVEDTDRQQDYPAQTLQCFKILTSKGIQITSGNQRSQAAVACDAVHYLKAALTAAGGVTRDHLVAGARALARSYLPALTFSSYLPKGYGDGISSVRRGAWDTACDCFRYTSLKTYPVS